MFIEAAGTSRDTPGPAAHTVNHQDRLALGGIPGGQSIGLEYRGHLNNKMVMVAAQLGHYQERPYE